MDYDIIINLITNAIIGKFKIICDRNNDQILSKLMKTYQKKVVLSGTERLV